MSQILYKSKRFSPATLEIIGHANLICQDYAEQGYDLTLRQLYYRFVALDLFPDDRWFWWDDRRGKWIRDPEHLNPESTKNADPNYKWVGKITNDARLAGYLDWDYIVDRTRNIEIPPSWRSPDEIVQVAVDSYHIDRWEDQSHRVEVWVEKDALAGVIDRATQGYRVPWFSCRGYTSQSELWGAAQRLRGHLEAGQMPVILHLGDHDPSGIDMTRDIYDRLGLFMHNDWYREQMPEDYQGTGEDGRVLYSEIQDHIRDFLDDQGVRGSSPMTQLPVMVERIALNWDQIEQYDLPPNPAKVTDSRARRYMEEYGRESWELDALEPRVLDALIQGNIERFLDRDRYDARLARENRERDRLHRMVDELQNLEEE